MHINFTSITTLLAGLMLIGTAQAESVTILDWQAWDKLSDQDKFGIAPSCGGSYVAPAIRATGTTDQPSLFHFDQGTTDKDKTSNMSGNVRIESQGLTSNSDQATYSPLTNQGLLAGDVILRTANEGMSGAEAQIDLETYYALLKNAQFVLHSQDIRGEADEIIRPDENTLVAQSLTFTRCAPSSNAWNIKSSKLTIDNEEGIATAWNSRLEIQSVPVMYIPYISFPLNDQPRTGFLTPTFGSSYSVPYYIHLAENYDDTVTPLISTTDGTLLRNEFRFLTDDHNGINEVDYRLLNSGSDNTNEDARWSFSHKQSGQLGQSLGYNFSTRWVSDINFDPAYNPGSDQTDYQYLDLSLVNNYAGYNNKLIFDYQKPVIDSVEEFETLNTTFRVHKGIVTTNLLYQTQTEFEENESTITAYDYEMLRVPELTVDIKPKNSLFGLQNTEQFRIGHFSNTLTDDRISSLSGSSLDLATKSYRAHASINLSSSYQNQWGYYFKPRLEMFATGYDMQNTEGFDLESKYDSENPTQVAWRASFDQGVSRHIQGDSFKHTFLPRLYYAYAPLTEQNGPILDSEINTTFNLFSASRFSGYDRVGDMSRISAGMKYQLKPNQKSFNLLELSASKGLKLSQERLLENGVADVDDTWQPEYSDWHAGLTFQPIKELIFTGKLAVEHDWSEVNTLSASAHYNPSGNMFAYVEASRAEDDDDILMDEIAGGAYFPIKSNIALIAYGSANKEALETDWQDFQINKILYGIEYDNCCWSLRLATLNAATDDEDSSSSFPINVERTYYFEFTLKGIGSDTGNIEALLRRLDFGYSGRMFNYH